MARRPETPLYQLPLELGRPVEPPAHGYQIRTGIIAEHRPREPLVDRSLWAMAEPIQLRSPEDAVRHLMTLVYAPWEQCVQEELWMCAVQRRGSIGYLVSCRKESIKPTSPSTLAGRETET